MSAHLPDLRQGDDYTLKIAYPIATDITGYKFYLTLKNTFLELDADAPLQYSCVAGTGSLDDPLAGICYFTVPASVMALVQAGSYYYDLQAISTIGEIQTLAPPIDDYEFKLNVIPQITQAIS